MNPGPQIADCLRELSLEHGRVGLVSNHALTGPSIPLEHLGVLREELPDLRFEETTAWYEGLRAVLSPAEQLFLRKGGELTRNGLEALVRAAP